LNAVKQFSSSSQSSNGPMGGTGGAGGTMGVGKGMAVSHSSSVISASASNAAGNNAGGLVSGGPSMSMSSMAHMHAPSTVNEAQRMASQTQLLKGSKDLEGKRVEQKAKSIVDEYLSLGDPASSFEDVKADFHPDHMKDVAEHMLSHVIDKKAKENKKTGELLDYLVNRHALLPSQLENAIYAIFEISSDLEIDIPDLWKNVGFLLAPVLASEMSLPMKFLLESVNRLEPNQVPKFLSNVLKSLVEISKEEKVGEMMRRSGLTINQLLPSEMPSEKVTEFTETNGFQFLASKDVRTNLARLLRDIANKNEDVFSWIEQNVPAENRDGKAKDFIRTLTRAVTESSLNYDEERSEWKLIEARLDARCALVKKYVDTNIEREKQVLFALQHLMDEMEHPNKLLTNIFNSLYNNDVISEQGFEAWLACNDPAEELGKGVASKSTTHFFTWMRENDLEAEDVED